MPGMIHLYGIPNCDTVKKARTWLQSQGAAFEFHDFKKEGLSCELLSQWMVSVDGELLLNRRGTTWRGLSATEQAQANTPQGLATLLTTHTSLIKRPVVQWPSRVTVGFDVQAWQALLP